MTSVSGPFSPEIVATKTTASPPQASDMTLSDLEKLSSRSLIFENLYLRKELLIHLLIFEHFYIGSQIWLILKS